VNSANYVFVNHEFSFQKLKAEDKKEMEMKKQLPFLKLVSIEAEGIKANTAYQKCCYH
jgi:hypothetical protein